MYSLVLKWGKLLKDNKTIVILTKKWFEVACRAEEESESSQKDTLFSQVYEDVAVQFLNLFLRPLQPARKYFNF